MGRGCECRKMCDKTHARQAARLSLEPDRFKGSGFLKVSSPESHGRGAKCRATPVTTVTEPTKRPFECRLDLLDEWIVSHHPPARRRSSDRVEGFFVQRFTKECAIRGLAQCWPITKGDVDRMRRDERIPIAASVVAIARPSIRARVVDHPRTHRVQLDVPRAGKEVTLGVDHRRFEATLPQRAGATVSIVHPADEARSHRVHHARHAGVVLGRHQQMNVIRHQRVGMDRAPEALTRFQQHFAVKLKIPLGAERLCAVVPALNNMQGHARKYQAR